MGCRGILLALVLSTPLWALIIWGVHTVVAFLHGVW